MLNIVVIMGRLTADPELKTTNSGNTLTSFAVAVERSFAKGGNRETDFINVVAWRSTAEFICKYFRKGQMIAINGSLQQRNYEDRDGNKRTAYEVVAQQVSFCGGKQDKPSDAGHGALSGAVDVVAEELAGMTDADFIDMDDGDLPF